MSGRLVKTKEQKKQEVWVVFYDDEDNAPDNIVIDKVFNTEKKAIDYVKGTYGNPDEDDEGEEMLNGRAMQNITKMVVE